MDGGYALETILEPSADLRHDPASIPHFAQIHIVRQVGDLANLLRLFSGSRAQSVCSIPHDVKVFCPGSPKYLKKQDLVPAIF
jgi:hypothetical protein